MGPPARGTLRIHPPASLRLFFAVALPGEVRQQLGGLRGRDNTAYRWVDPALLHVTLAFLGRQPVERLAVLRAVGAAASSGSAPGVLRLGGAGSFGPRRAPRVLWIGLDGDVQALLALQARLATALRGAGFALEERPFSPHITLARRREGARDGSALEWPPEPSPGNSREFTMDHLTLVESRLSPQGPTYIPVLEFPLGRAV